ncbi:glycosyltransferase family 2 protein [bacterium]|nr:glycosyltransferase family 2 protein [bacterium]
MNASRSPVPDPNPQSAPLLSIITIFWNSRDDVPSFFGAVEKAREALDFEIEVLAIDNASEDGTADAIAKQFPWVHLIRNDENLGFAQACNQGLAAATGDYLLLLNPDCEANSKALAGMIEFLKKHPRVGAAGCTLLHGDGLPQNSYHREPSWWSYWGTHSLISPLVLRIRKALHVRRLRSRKARPIYVEWLMGACLMVPRPVAEEIGGLDPTYFMYGEDVDWCRRIRDAGYRIAHLPQWRIVHHHGTSSRHSPEFAFRRLYRSLLMYMHKHLHGVPAKALRYAVVLDMLMRLPIHMLGRESERLESVRRVLAMYRYNNPTLYPEDRPRPEAPGVRRWNRTHGRKS